MQNTIRDNAKSIYIYEKNNYTPEEKLRKKFDNLSKAERIDLRRGSDNATQYLYKYLPPPNHTDNQATGNLTDTDVFIERVSSLLINGTLYLSSRNQFNDPFDTSPSYIKEPILTKLTDLASHISNIGPGRISHKGKKQNIDRLIKNSDALFDEIKYRLEIIEKILEFTA